MTALTTARRALGAALIALVIIPFYRLLERPVAGFAGQGTAGHAATSAAVLWSGAAVVALAALLAALLLPTRSLERRLARAGQWLARPPTAALALGLGSIAAVITAAFGLLVLDGKPNLIDAMSQLVQARYLAAGTLAGPTSPLAPFWHIQNTVLTENGWVSHYPPGHVVLLALGFRVGAVWAVGPVLMGTTAAFACLTADRLFPDDRATARLGAALVTLNPFLIGLAGAYMNHIAAAAFTTAATYFTLRARDGRWTWTIATGAAAGMAFATRPLSALAIVAAVAPTCRASFAAVVVLPEPWSPARRTTAGCPRSEKVRSPTARRAVSSSWTIFTTCWPAVRVSRISAPTARSRTRATKAFTTR